MSHLGTGTISLGIIHFPTDVPAGSGLEIGPLITASVQPRPYSQKNLKTWPCVLPQGRKEGRETGWDLSPGLSVFVCVCCVLGTKKVGIILFLVGGV